MDEHCTMIQKYNPHCTVQVGYYSLTIILHRPQSWKGDFLSSRRETQRTDTHHNLDLVTGNTDRDAFPQQPQPSLFSAAPTERKTSKVAKIYRRIVNPSKTEEVSEGSAYFLQTNLDKATSSLQPMGHHEYLGGFK